MEALGMKHQTDGQAMVSHGSPMMQMTGMTH